MSSPPESDPTTEFDAIVELESTTVLEPTKDPDQSVGFDRLLDLFQEVTRARAELSVARRAPLGRSRLVDAPRTRLLTALEAYTAELNSRNLPVPYGIRDDLRIQRRILGRISDTSR